MTNSDDSLEKQIDIDIHELFSVVWKKKLFIFSAASFSTLIGVLYALYLPNIYTSSALLAPADEAKSNANMLSQFSGIAGLAGVSLPSDGKDLPLEAIERIKSYEFFAKFVLPSILLQDLMAIKSWDPLTNTVYYKSSHFDNDTWVRNASYPKLVKPSNQEAYRSFKKIMTISQNKKTGFVSISIKHQSPYIAKKWTDIIINAINKSMRDEEKNKSLKSIEFLNTQLLKVNYEEIRQAISFLQQEQMKAMMLIEANEDYIFKFIDSPIVPELKSEPKRSLIVILAFMLGFVLSLMLTLLMHFSGTKK